jgi:hypothetical protein
MTDYTQRLWRFPALAIAANVVLLLWLVLFRRIAVEMTMELYEVMFWATPVIGLVVLSWVAWLKLWGPPHLRVQRAFFWSLLAVTVPIWLFALQVVLSGFAR